MTILAYSYADLYSTGDGLDNIGEDANRIGTIYANDLDLSGTASIGVGAPTTYEGEFYDSSAGCFVRSSTGTTATAGFMTQNSNANSLWAIQVNSSGNWELYNYNTTKSRIRFAANGSAVLNSGTSSLTLLDDGALKQSVGCESNWYNLDSGVDYERGYARWDTDVFEIGTEAGGTGTARDVSIVRDGDARLVAQSASTAIYSNAGALNFLLETGQTRAYRQIVPGTAGGYNLGSSALRWGTVYSGNLDLSGTATVAGIASDATLPVTIAGVNRLEVDDSQVTTHWATGVDPYVEFRKTGQTGRGRISGSSGTGLLFWTYAPNQMYERLQITSLGEVQHKVNTTSTWYNLDSGVDYERLRAAWDTNEIRMISEAGGTGVVRDFEIGTDGSHMAAKASSLVFRTDGTYRMQVTTTSVTFNTDLRPNSANTQSVGTTAIPFADVHCQRLFTKVLRTDVETITASTATLSAVTNHTILADCTSNAITLTLPSTATGLQYVIKKIDSSTNAVVIDGNGTETVDGSLTATLTTQYESINIVSDGSNWFIV